MKNLLWYLTFEGRCNRLWFWLSQLAVWPMLFALVVVVSILFGRMPNAAGLAEYDEINNAGKVAMAICVLLLIWFQTCMEVKRWHDRDKSGWWVWIALIPVIGSFWVLIECGFRRGTEGPNRFGAQP